MNTKSAAMPDVLHQGRILKVLNCAGQMDLSALAFGDRPQDVKVREVCVCVGGGGGVWLADLVPDGCLYTRSLQVMPTSSIRPSS